MDGMAEWGGGWNSEGIEVAGGQVSLRGSGERRRGRAKPTWPGSKETRLTEKRSHKKNIERKKNRWKRITRRGRKEGGKVVEESGCSRRLELGSLAVLGRLAHCGWWESGCSFQLQFAQFDCALFKVHGVY